MVTLGYDAAGRRTSLTYSNGSTTTYGYDAASRVTSIVHRRSTPSPLEGEGGGEGVIESVTYTYDAGGNRTGITRANGAAALLPAAMTAAAYDAANQLIQFNGNPVTHDANGNMTSDGVNTYTWDARNRLASLATPAGPATFAYDALGRRISKTINGVTTQFLYDGNDIVAEMQGGAITAFYLRGLNIDEPFVRISSTGNEYYHTDALGSVLALTNDAGAVTTTYSYEPFGKTTITGTSTNPFQYTGRENDQPALSGVEGGLYYYRGRYYSVLLQRFLSEDPIASQSFDVNPYLYARNNPLRWIDPTGLTVWPTDYGAVTGTFGEPRPSGPHNGVDIRNPSGGNTNASDSGTVLDVAQHPRGGNQIRILHDDGSVSGYAHTEPRPGLQPGQRVGEGESIGRSDGSGGVTPHLHYTFRRCRTCPKSDPLEHLPSPGNRPPPSGPRGRK